MGYQPHAKQVAAHRAFLMDGFDRGVLFWGRQVGKSYFGIQHLQMAALLRQGQYFIVFNTYKHAKDVMWRQYLHTLHKDLIKETNSSELLITFHHIAGTIKLPGLGAIDIEHDPSLPPSTIQLLGSDQADDHRGRKAHGMIFDEYQDQMPEYWDTVYKYFFTTTKGWACFVGTAKGYNHWYEMVQDAKAPANKRWYFSQATWRDNPVIDPQFIKDERQESERKGTLNAFLQEVELEFRSVQGSVYPNFDRDVHVVPLSRMPESGTDFMTIDFGWAADHPTAVNFVRVDIEGRWWVYDEIHVTETSLDDTITMMKMKMGERRFAGCIADSARPDLIDYIMQKHVPFAVIPSPKTPNSVPQGIQLLGQKLKARTQLAGPPQPNFYVTPNCKYTIEQMEKYKYAEAKKDHLPSELPLKKDDDHPDALRYLALYIKYQANQREKEIDSGVRFNDFGLM